MIDFDKYLDLLNPKDLQTSPLKIDRVMLIGSCASLLMAGLLEKNFGCKTDILHIDSIDTFNFSSLDKTYDFQILAFPMFNVLPRQRIFREDLNDLDLARIRFEDSVKIMKDFLRSSMGLNIERSLTTFVMNFFVPIKNPWSWC